MGKQDDRIKWSLSTPRTDFQEGEIVKMRGDMGGFKMVIEKIHNKHYAKCRDLWPFGIKGKRRHVNLNCLKST